MPFGESSSAFWFYGRLHPAQRVPAFDAQELRVEEGVTLEIIWDGIGVWSRPGRRAFKQPGEATALFRLVVAAYALLWGDAFEVTNDGWIEATEATLDGSVVGFRVERPTDEVDPASEESTAMRAAAEIAIAVRTLPAYRLAVRDAYSALRDPSDDAFFFAYRAVEDAARAVSGASTTIEDKHWKRLHQRLGRDAADGKKRLEPLTRARRAAAHGDQHDSALGEARRRKSELINDARRIVIAVLETTPTLSFESLPVRFTGNA